MSQENKLDALFRDALGDKGMEYAPEHWEQMETLLPKQKKPAAKRKLGLIALALLFLSSIAYFGLHNETETLGDMSPIPSLTAETNNSESTFPTATKNTSPATPSLAVQTEGSQTNQVTTDQAKKNPNSGLESASKLSLGAIKEKVKQSPSPEPIERQNDIQIEPDAIENGPSILEVPVTKKSEEDTSPASNEPELTKELPSLKQDFTPYPRKSITAIQSMTKPWINSCNDFWVPNESEKGSRLNPSEATRRRRVYHWTITPYMNFGMIKQRQGLAVSNWKANTESTKNYFEYGANARYQKGRYGVVFGLAMQNWKEKTNYIKEEHEYTFSYSYKLIERNYQQRADGSYVGLIKKVTDTTSHTVTSSEVCADCPVSFSYITVPVAFHYDMGRGKLTGYAEAGMNFSFLNKASGVYSVETMNEYGQTNLRFANADKTYFNPMVMRSNLTLGANYRFRPDISLNVQANYQRSLNSMMTRYRQETDFYGFGIGLEFLIH